MARMTSIKRHNYVGPCSLWYMLQIVKQHIEGWIFVLHQSWVLGQYSLQCNQRYKLIVTSAILLLQQHHFQRISTIAMPNVLREISFDNFWPESFEAVNRLITAATSSMNLTAADPNKADCIPIFFTHVLYQVGCILLVLARGTSLDDEVGEKLGVVKSLLLRVNARWRLAGKSLSKRPSFI
jgi:hypothetical protein